VKRDAYTGQDPHLIPQLPSALVIDVYEALPSYPQPFYSIRGNLSQVHCRYRVLQITVDYYTLPIT
jgi:hypothetical protein